MLVNLMYLLQLYNSSIRINIKTIFKFVLKFRIKKSKQ